MEDYHHVYGRLSPTLAGRARSRRAPWSKFFPRRVQGELQRECAALPDRPKVFHYRSAGGVEVDFVIENPHGQCAGIEVKSTRSLSDKHFNGLRDLEAGLGKRFHCGVVLYGGEEMVRFGDRLWAVPAL